jgi:hypothetical protein
MLKLRQHFIPVVSEILVPCFEDRYFHSIRRVVEDKDAAFRQRFLGLPAKRRPFSSQQYFEGEMIAFKTRLDWHDSNLGL